ncbi:MAG TPA: 23S rRNA (adenine(2503)-C(2))-methyltransferase RlmN [Bacteroidales bacterium]|nr:23S rRNA (adenine(2503)-C(2))-methyltransferase RlmN [Bacteroidales bacterium]
MENSCLCGMSPVELTELFGKDGLTEDHAIKITNGLYKNSSSLRAVPLKLRKLIDSKVSSGLYLPSSFEESLDGTKKYLFINSQGQRFESVFMPENKRNTLCVSSQSGCRMGCPFCQTGKYGFHGNLSAGDILNQLLSIPESGKITHIVFMGMGEPMDNYENVLKSCNILTSQWGRSLSPRKITVSTVGITPAINRFLKESECNLAVSLFSPFFDERSRIVPVEKKYPIGEIIGLLKGYTLRRKRRVTLSYIMIKGLNDTNQHLQELKNLLKDSDIRVNLLPYHIIAGDCNESSTPERMQIFKHELVISGISASVRKSRGVDISAACGLLAGK